MKEKNGFYRLLDFYELEEKIQIHLKTGGSIGKDALKDARTLLQELFNTDKLEVIDKEAQVPARANLDLFFMEKICRVISSLKGYGDKDYVTNKLLEMNEGKLT